jgi:hypothetical protein
MLVVILVASHLIGTYSTTTGAAAPRTSQDSALGRIPLLPYKLVEWPKPPVGGRRAGQAVAFGQHPAAARFGHFERALETALVDERIDVRPVEQDQTPEEGEFVVGLQQLRSCLLDHVQGSLEML